MSIRLHLKRRLAQVLALALIIPQGVTAFAAIDMANYRQNIHREAGTQGPLDLKAKKVPNAIGAFFTWKLDERKAVVKGNEKVATDQEQLKTKRKTARATIETFKSELAKAVRHPEWSHRLELLADQLSSDIEGAPNEKAVGLYEGHLHAEAEKVKAIVSSLGSISQDAGGQIDEIAAQAPKGFLTKSRRSQIKDLKASITAATEIDEARGLAAQAVELLSADSRNFADTETTRRSEEKRADVAAPSESASILSSYLALSPSATLAAHQGELKQALEQDAGARAYVYREMRMLQVLSKKKVSATTGEALKARAENNEAVLLALVDGNKQAIKTAASMRASIRTIRSAIFGRTLPKGALKKITASHRERILKDVLSNPDLAVLTLAATAAPAPLPPKPQKPTTKPVKPEKPTVYRSMSKSHKQSLKRDYLSAKVRYASGKIAYARAVEKFKYDRERYLEAVVRSKQAEGRRTNAREALATYLAQAQPELFTKLQSPDGKVYNTAAAIASNSKRKLERRMERLDGGRRERLGSELGRARQRMGNFSSMRSVHYHETRYLRDDSYDWFLMFTTGNPMWLISPDIARIQMYCDILDHGSINHGQVTPDFAAQVILPEDRQAAPPAILESRAAVDQFIESTPQAQPELDAHAEQRAQDTDLSLAGMNAFDALKAEMPEDLPLDSEGTEPLGNAGEVAEPDLTDLADPAAVEGDWTIFKGESDVAWADDAAVSTEVEAADEAPGADAEDPADTGTSESDGS